MSDPIALLKLKVVSKRYPLTNQPNTPYVLKDVNIDIEPGESLAITGPSGSGKSTLLSIMGTLDKPTSGQVLLKGKDLTTLDDVKLAEIRNRQIGFVFQLHHLLPQCTVLENVLLPTLVGSGEKENKKELEQRARKLLERVGLAQHLCRMPGGLSGGERQRVAVVRSLINQPGLLLADEPTGSLDHVSAENLIQLLVELNREQGVTLVVATHAEELAEKMGRVMNLRDGKLLP